MPSAFFSRLVALLLVAGGLSAAYFAYQEAVVPLLSGGSAVHMQTLEEAPPGQETTQQALGPAVLQTPGLSEAEKSLPVPPPEGTPAPTTSLPDTTASQAAVQGAAAQPGSEPTGAAPAPAAPSEAAPVETTAPKLELSVRRPDDVRVRITAQDEGAPAQ